jgi:hypothetical protein
MSDGGLGRMSPEDKELRQEISAYWYVIFEFPEMRSIFPTQKSILSTGILFWSHLKVALSQINYPALSEGANGGKYSPRKKSGDCLTA